MEDLRLEDSGDFCNIFFLPFPSLLPCSHFHFLGGDSVSDQGSLRLSVAANDLDSLVTFPSALHLPNAGISDVQGHNWLLWSFLRTVNSYFYTKHLESRKHIEVLFIKNSTKI
jgi:hypothetical protein